jgi:signal transduction histidine kinase
VTDIRHLRHELRTPVNAVLGYSEMLLEDAPVHAEALESVIAAARAILAAIDRRLSPTTTFCDARDFGSLQDTMRPHQQRIIDLVATLRSAVARWRCPGIGPTAIRSRSGSSSWMTSPIIAGSSSGASRARDIVLSAPRTGGPRSS